MPSKSGYWLGLKIIKLIETLSRGIFGFERLYLHHFGLTIFLS